MAKSSGTTRSVGSSGASASRTSFDNAIAPVFYKSGSTASGNIYDMKGGGSTGITLQEMVSANGEKKYRVHIQSGDQGSVGTFTQSEVQKMSEKLASMSLSERTMAIGSYIRDSYNPEIAQTYADILSLRKKYLGV